MRINFILFIASSFEGRGHKNIQQVAPTFPYFLASFLSNQTNRSLFYDLPPHLKSVKKGSGQKNARSENGRLRREKFQLPKEWEL